MSCSSQESKGFVFQQPTRVRMWPFPPFDHSAILSAIPPFRPPFRHSAIPPFRHSAISTIPTYKLPTYIQTYEVEKWGLNGLGRHFFNKIYY
jgi:hypothetical protein